MFIQVINFTTSRMEEGKTAVDAYRASVEGKSTVRRGILAKDRDKDNSYINIVFFDSYEDAMKNSELPETHQLSETLGKLSDGPPAFWNLEVLDDQQM